MSRPGTNNDLTVAKTSPLFVDILRSASRMKILEGYVINGHLCMWYCYYLVDGIYPDREFF